MEASIGNGNSLSELGASINGTHKVPSLKNMLSGSSRVLASVVDPRNISNKIPLIIAGLSLGSIANASLKTTGDDSTFSGGGNSLTKSIKSTSGGGSTKTATKKVQYSVPSEEQIRKDLAPLKDFSMLSSMGLLQEPIPDVVFEKMVKGFMQVNEYRVNELNKGPVISDWMLCLAAYKHRMYLYTTKTFTHSETDTSNPYYSGKQTQDRVQTTGYFNEHPFLRYSLAEFIGTFGGQLKTPRHRAFATHPSDACHMGIGPAPDWQTDCVYITSSSPQEWLDKIEKEGLGIEARYTMMPANGQKNVPVQGTFEEIGAMMSRGEMKNGVWECGFPATFSYVPDVATSARDVAPPLDIISAELIDIETNEPVETYLLTHESRGPSAGLQWRVVMASIKPMKHNTKYVFRVKFKDPKHPEFGEVTAESVFTTEAKKNELSTPKSISSSSGKAIADLNKSRKRK